MTRIFGLLTLSLAIVFAWTGLAGAQSFDMKGTWTGTSRSIVSGLPPHHPASVQAKPADSHRLTSLLFTIKIEGQDDGRVWGTLGSAAKVEPIIGAISRDGKQLRMVLQGGGFIEGVVLDADSIEIFYMEHSGSVSVVATNLWKRQK